MYDLDIIEAFSDVVISLCQFKKNPDLKSSLHTVGLYIKIHTLAVWGEGNVPNATCSISLLGSVIFRVHIIKFQLRPVQTMTFTFLPGTIKT